MMTSKATRSCWLLVVLLLLQLPGNAIGSSLGSTHTQRSVSVRKTSTNNKTILFVTSKLSRGGDAPAPAAPKKSWGLRQFALGFLAAFFRAQYEFLLTPKSARVKYIMSSWRYGDEKQYVCDPTTNFWGCAKKEFWQQYAKEYSGENHSPWTYMTDFYVMAAIIIGVVRIASDAIASKAAAIRSGNNAAGIEADKSVSDDYKRALSRATSAIRSRSLLLLATYAIQFYGGSIAKILGGEHFPNDFFGAPPECHSVWNFVLSAAAASGAVIGSLATSIVKRLELDDERAAMETKTPRTPRVYIQDAFWVGYGIAFALITLLLIEGSTGFHPDTFVAGMTRTFPTFYLMYVVLQRWWIQVTKHHPPFAMIIPTATAFGVQLGFVLSAVLMPVYAFLVEYMSFSIPTVNAVFHSWRCISYLIQVLMLGNLIAHSRGQ